MKPHKNDQPIRMRAPGHRTRDKLGLPRQGRDIERGSDAEEICSLVADHFGGDREKAALWFRIKNPMLGGLSPRDLLVCGRGAQLKRRVLEALSDP